MFIGLRCNIMSGHRRLLILWRRTVGMPVGVNDDDKPEFLPIKDSSDNSRRDFLKMMGFGLAAVSTAACEAPDFNNKLEGFDKKVYEKIHHPKNLEPVELSKNILFTKSITRLEQISFESEKYDLVFFDAFAPSKQPDIWSKENFSLIKDAMKKSGVIVTYSSSRKLKNILKELDFKIETLAGPKGKKEMTRAIK